MDDFSGETFLQENDTSTERMKEIFVMVKESLQYIGIIVIALLSGLFLVIKMAVTEVKEETRDIVKASNK